MTDVSTLETGDTAVFRAGGKAEIYSAKLTEGINTVLRVNFFGSQNEATYQLNGRYCRSGSSPFDIVEIIKREKLVYEAWLNVYSNGNEAYPHPTKDAADHAGKSSSRIACLHIRQEYKRGEGL